MSEQHPLEKITGCVENVAAVSALVAVGPTIFLTEHQRSHDKEYFEKNLKGMPMELLSGVRFVAGLVLLGALQTALEKFIPGSINFVRPLAIGYMTYLAGDFSLATIYNVGYHLPEPKSEWE